MPRQIPPPANSDNLDACLEEHLNRIKDHIRKRATDLTGTSFPGVPGGHSSFGLQELTQAIDEFAPGIPVQIERGRWYTILFQYFPPFTILCFLLAIIFGCFGFNALSKNAASTVGSGFMDIAKIFAGAIVGSTSVTAISNFTRKKS